MQLVAAAALLDHHRGLDVRLAQGAGGPRGAVAAAAAPAAAPAPAAAAPAAAAVGQSGDPLVSVAERVPIALQRAVVPLHQALRLAIAPRALLHAARRLGVHDGSAGGEQAVVVRRCGRHDSRSRTERSG